MEEEVVIRLQSIGGEKIYTEYERMAESADEAAAAHEHLNATLKQLSANTAVTQLQEQYKAVATAVTDLAAEVERMEEEQAALAQAAGESKLGMLRQIAEQERMLQELQAMGYQFQTDSLLSLKEQYKAAVAERVQLEREINEYMKLSQQEMLASAKAGNEELNRLDQDRFAKNKLAYQQSLETEREDLSIQKQINAAWEQRNKLILTSVSEINKGYTAASKLVVEKVPTFTRNESGPMSFGWTPNVTATTTETAEQAALRREVEREGALEVANINLAAEDQLSAALKRRIELREAAEREAIEAEKALAEQQAKDDAARIARAREAQKSLQQEAAAATRATTGTGGGFGGVNLIGAAVNTFLGTQAIKYVSELTDKYLLLQNRTALVTHTDEQRGEVMQKIIEISAETRQDLDTTSTLFQRLATSATGLGLTYRGLLGVTKTLNEAIVVGGSTSVQAKAGMLQLAEGFSFGALRGRQLRSVIQELPGVADILAAHFNTSRAGLFALGAQGKITAAEMIKAFTELADQTQAKFDKTTPTIEQAFSVLQTRMIEFIGQSPKMHTAVALLSDGLVEFANHLDDVSRLLATGAIYLGLKKIFTLIETSLVALSTGAGFFGVLTKALSLFAITYVTFDDTGEHVQNLKVWLSDAEEKAVDLDKALKDMGGEIEHGAAVVGLPILTGLIAGMASEMTVAAAADGGVGLMITAVGLLGNAVEGLTAKLTLLGETTVWKAISSSAGIATAIGGFLALTATGDAPPSRVKPEYGGTAPEPFNYVDKGAVGPNRNTLHGINALSLVGLSPQGLSDTVQQSTLDEYLAGRANSGDPTGSHKKTFADYLQDERELLEATKAEGEQRYVMKEQVKVEIALRRQLTAAEAESLAKATEAVKTQQVLNAAIKSRQELERTKTLSPLEGDARIAEQAKFQKADQLGLTDREFQLKFAGTADLIGRNAVSEAQTQRYYDLIRQLNPTLVIYRENLITLNAALKTNDINQQQYNVELDNLRLKQLSTATDIKSGIERGFLDVDKATQDLSHDAENLITSSFDKATESIINFVKTGKFQITDFVTYILEEIAKIELKKNVIGPLASGLESALDLGNKTVPTHPGVDATEGGAPSGGGEWQYRTPSSTAAPASSSSSVRVENYNLAPGTHTTTTTTRGLSGETIVRNWTRQVSAQQTEDTAYGAGLAPMLASHGVKRTQGVFR